MPRRTRLLLGGCLLAISCLVATSCGADRGAGIPTLKVSADFITWVPTDGTDGRLHLLVDPAGRTATDVRLVVDAAPLAGHATPVAGDRRCAAQGAEISCRLTDVRAAVTFTPVQLVLTDRTGVDEPFQLPVRATVDGRKVPTYYATVRIVDRAQLVGLPAGHTLQVAARGTARLRPGLLNVGPRPARRLHLLVTGPDGVALRRSFTNCRYSTTLPNEALCTFPGSIAAHHAVLASAAFAFDMVGLSQGELSYLATTGPPEGPLDAFDVRGKDSQLRLEPVPAERFRSPTGGVGYGGVLEVVTDVQSDLAAVAVADPQQPGQPRDRYVRIGVANRGPGILEAPYIDPGRRWAGHLVFVPPGGTRVRFIPFPGEEGWAPCQPQRAGAKRYVCEIPEHLDRDESWLLTVHLRRTAGTSGEPGHVRVELRDDVAGRDQNPRNDRADLHLR